MRSMNQANASRANGTGAKSQGPTTPEGPTTPQGKAASSGNGTTHGLCSRDVVLSNEDPAAWEALRVSFHHQWLPANQVEALLVDDLAATQWKLLRAESIETATLNSEMDILLPEVEKTFRKIDEPTRQALAFKSLADNSKTLAALERHQTRLHRQFQRTWKQLSEIRKSQPELQPGLQQAEPNPEPNPNPTPARQIPTKSYTTERIPAAAPAPKEDETPPCRAA